MSEEDVRLWVAGRFGAAALERLELFVAMLREEATQQNLVAPASLPVVWERHVRDSLQLIGLVPDGLSPWLDIGTGAGFPGLAIACNVSRPMILVEPRARRVEFLTRVVAAAGLKDVVIEHAKVERVAATAGVISARAVAGLSEIFAMAAHCAGPETIWCLPRGRGGRDEVTQVRQQWRGVFHVKQSATDLEAAIVVASGVMRR